MVVFYSGGVFQTELLNAGITVHDLGKKGPWDNLRPLAKLVGLLRKNKPGILYAWMPLANIVSALVKPFIFKHTRVVWGIRASDLDFKRYSFLTRVSSWLESLFSRFADLSISNSITGREHAIARGFSHRNFRSDPKRY